MNIYTVIFYSDWGQIYWKYEPETKTVPHHISKFVLKKADEQLGISYDNQNIGCRFYFIKDQYCDKWTYSVGEDIVCIIYEVGYFDHASMKMAGSKLSLSK